MSDNPGHARWPAEEIRNVGETGPTMDSIEMAEFESHSDLKAWLGKNAPAFAR